MTTGVELIAKERQRQVEVEHWSAKHDDDHDSEEMAIAAACYALPKDLRAKAIWNSYLLDMLWPWDSAFWRPAKRLTPATRIKELVKAGALIAAEIDRLKRLGVEPTTDAD